MLGSIAENHKEVHMNFGFKLPQVLKMAERTSDQECERLVNAHKFCLSLTLEAHRAARDYAEQMREFDVYALPYENCYFEIVFSDCRVGLLAWEANEVILCRVYNWRPEGILLSRCTVSVPQTPHERPITYPDSNDRALPPTFETLTLRTEYERLDQEQAIAAIPFVDTAIGSLHLRDVVSVPSAQKRRSTVGSRVVPAEIFSHRVIHVPTDPLVTQSPATTRSTRRKFSPVRMHWRRGHIRRLPDGRLTRVAPHLVGHQEFGAISSEYHIGKVA